MALTPNKILTKPANGDTGWDVPLNSDFDIIDLAFGGVTPLNATAGSATLTTAQFRPLLLSITGGITGNVTYTIPAGKGGQWIVKNATTDTTTGPWSVYIVSAGGGSPVSIPRNNAVTIYSDGSSVGYSSVAGDGSVTTAIIADGAVTYPKMSSTALAIGTDISANTASKLVPVSSIWSSAAYVAATYAVSVALDFSTGYNFSMTLTGNLVLANPTNIKVGQSGIIVLTQDGTGGRTTSFGSYFQFANGTVPTLDTAAGRKNVLSYTVLTSTSILVSAFVGVR
jgi:hypothetical protein